jgi:predicted transglutaminase-like cysteine proteinase
MLPKFVAYAANTPRCSKYLIGNFVFFSSVAIRATGLAFGVALAVTLQPAALVAGSSLTAYAAAKPPVGALGACRAFAGACHHRNPPTPQIDDAGLLARASAANAAVNREVVPATDQALYGRQNVWALPQHGQGDCKHLALMKKLLLVRSGVPASNLLLAVVIGSTEELHAVLVLRTKQADYVLDNLESRILPWTATGYTFLKMQDPADGAHWDAILQGPRARRS